jgi:hypothetical protein
MILARNQDCDSIGKSFFLATDDTNIFDPSARSALNDQVSERIPCFKVITTPPG